jgi:hypothetical protein
MAADVDDGFVNHKLESDFEDGTFVNGTLNITGTLSGDSTDMEWILFDSVGILGRGSYFSEVTPLSVNRWQWQLAIDVSEINCTCSLNLIQGIDGSNDHLMLSIMIFIGEGPFIPALQAFGVEITDSNNYEFTFTGIVANGALNDSTILISYCQWGVVCDSNTRQSLEQAVTWDGNDGVLFLNNSDLSLTEGYWEFELILRDNNLIESATAKFMTTVDLSAPTAVLDCSKSVDESSAIILDGSASSDGFWTSELQVVWYITAPNGTTRNPAWFEYQGLRSLILNPTTLGNWTVRLEVIDMRGRISSIETIFEVLNVAPEAFISLDELDLNNHSYRMPQWADWTLDSADSYDPGDNTSLVHRWYVDGELVSTVSKLNVSELNLQPGEHEVILEVIDAGGASGTSSMVLEVYAAESELNSTPVLGWLTIALVMIALIVFAVKYAQSREETSTSVPRWQDNRYTEVEGDDSSVEAMWDEPAQE